MARVVWWAHVRSHPMGPMPGLIPCALVRTHPMDPWQDLSHGPISGFGIYHFSVPSSSTYTIIFAALDQ